MWSAILPLLLGCRSAPAPGEGRRYTESLTAIAADPGQTATLCGALTDPDLRGDCVLVGATALAGEDPEAAGALCAALPEGLHRDECGFVLAEKTGEATHCARAGRFALDCRMHLLQRQVARASLPADPVALTAPAAAILAASGISPDDEHAWTLLYRDALSRQEPLDLPGCDASAHPALCRRAGVGLFHDRLNYARDTDGVPASWCESRQGIAVLDHTPDPDLALALAQRTDICP